MQAFVHRVRDLDCSAEESVRQWMTSDQTLTAARGALAEASLPEADARVLVAVAYMARDDQVFGGEHHDVVMKREAARLLGKMTEGASDAASLADDVRRGVRFYKAWSQADRPALVQELMGAVAAAAHAQRDRAGEQGQEEEEGPPEELMDAILKTGGREAAEAARRHFDQVLHLDVAPLEQQIAEVAERAFWDVAQERVAGGDMDVLFHLIEEVHKTLIALSAHRPGMQEELRDTCDPAWLRQQADHGALEPDDVRRLVAYLSGVVCDWQAPADEAAAREWAEAEKAAFALADGVEPMLRELLAPFLRRAIDQLRTLYRRILALRDEGLDVD